MIKLSMSVHTLVDFVLREGDIDNRVFNLETMTRGSQMHAYYQTKQNKRYLAEQYLEQTFFYGQYEVILQGRVDGIIVSEDDDITIEEIKTTNTDLETFFLQNENWHLGQAKCYALMYALKNKMSEIKIQLTYISQVDESKMVKNYVFYTEQLATDINHYFSLYFSFYDQIDTYQKNRNETLKHLNFPFKTVRQSQSLMMEEVEKSLETNGRTYINAPTGSGKTMAALFPSLKKLPEKEKLKIFYLTAKGSGKAQAENALKLIDKDATVKSINLNAKEKMCLNDTIACNPDRCPFAKNYYGKLRDALLDIYINYNAFDQQTILEVARKHALCPFEFQLDLSLFCDVVIADYNYLFDPFVYLRRFFEVKNSEYIVLIDEAHNLPRRVSDNFSLSLDFSVFYTLRSVLKGPEHKPVRLIINRIAKVLDEYKQDIIDNFQLISDLPTDLLTLLEKLLVTGSEYIHDLGEAVDDKFTDLFFMVNKFLKIYNVRDESFILFTEIDELGAFFPKFHLKCLNPTRFINEALKSVENAIFFSATLAPETYYKTLLGMESEVVHIPNPFDKEQLLIMVDRTVSLYYKDRTQTINEVANKIISAISVKVGNYLVYTPSFQYLDLLEPILREKLKVNLMVQKPAMNDSEKEKFLDAFTHSPQETCLGIAVMGGSFSEGVDLVSDRLSGVIILGVGYPPPSFEKEQEKEYFDRIYDDGVSYAYVFPALNKILQTMGRVIRSEDDHGFVLLLDKRYNYSPYREHMQSYNGKLLEVRRASDITKALSIFFYD